MFQKVLPDIQDIIAILVLILSVMTFAHIDARTIGITIGLTIGIVMALSVITGKDEDIDD